MIFIIKSESNNENSLNMIKKNGSTGNKVYQYRDRCCMENAWHDHAIFLKSYWFIDLSILAFLFVSFYVSHQFCHLDERLVFTYILWKKWKKSAKAVLRFATHVRHNLKKSLDNRAKGHLISEQIFDDIDFQKLQRKYC